MSTLNFMNDAKKAKVVEAAQKVFFRYGYRRVTMADLAEAADMSRPALYLLFCNKEEVFKATLKAFTAGTLAELHGGLPAQATLKEKLRYAFEVWAIRPFILLMASPDAKELIDCSFTFARDTIDRSYTAFEAELEAILAPLEGRAGPLTPAAIARILTRSVHGFKETASSPDELRALVDGLLTMVLAPLDPA